jgi:hypothetical protein
VGAHLPRGGQRISLERADERRETGVFDGPHLRVFYPTDRDTRPVRARQNAVDVDLGVVVLRH